MQFSLRDSFLGRSYYRAAQKYLMPGLVKAGLKPNQLTLAGVACALIVPVGYYLHPTLGLFLMVLSGLADSLDGLLARFYSNPSKFGAFLDSSLDRLSDFCYLAGIWVLFWSSPRLLAATALILMALLFTVLISYVKARAEALGIECRVGIMERGVRVLYLITWILLAIIFNRRSAFLWWGLVAYNLLSLWTTFQRIRYVRMQMPLTDGFGKSL